MAMGAAEMVALMNNSALLMQSSTGGTLSKTGSGRDADGTIDRSPPPTEEVKVVLKELKRAIDRYGIDMTLEFRTQGATQYGTITKSRFNSIITVTFGVEKGFLWHDENGKTPKLDLLNQHYGTGATDIHLKGKKQVAWMDLCEDLGETDASWIVKAAEFKDFGPSAQSMMLDAADGVIDGVVGDGSADGGFKDGSSRGGLMGEV